jgi:DNA-binding XRE family transcriptional regulator
MAFPTRTRLKSKRLWRDMTQQQVADAAGAKRGVIQEWEAATHVPRADQAVKEV